MKRAKIKAWAFVTQKEIEVCRPNWTSIACDAVKLAQNADPASAALLRLIAKFALMRHSARRFVVTAILKELQRL